MAAHPCHRARVITIEKLQRRGQRRRYLQIIPLRGPFWLWQTAVQSPEPEPKEALHRKYGTLAVGGVIGQVIRNIRGTVRWAITSLGTHQLFEASKKYIYIIYIIIIYLTPFEPKAMQDIYVNTGENPLGKKNLYLGYICYCYSVLC